MAFENRQSFDPQRDSKIPLKRDPASLAIRFGLLAARLLCSRHPEDFWIWARSMVARRRPLSYPIPWLSFPAIRRLRGSVKEGSTVFEFGAGHSTVFWAQRGACVCTVEESPEWHGYLEGYLRNHPGLTVELLFEPEQDKYIGSIGRYPKQHFDLVLVDGSFRRECTRAAIDHVKPGGLLVLDNTDWHWFREQPIDCVPPTWRKQAYPGYAPMMGYISETTVWQAPASGPFRSMATGNFTSD